METPSTRILSKFTEAPNFNKTFALSLRDFSARGEMLMVWSTRTRLGSFFRQGI